MTWPILLFLGLQVAVFVVWAALAFRTLFLLRSRAVSRSGRAIPGPLTFLNAMSDWLRDPAERRPRHLLAGATLLMFALSFVSAFA